MAEDLMHRTLRWMQENLRDAANATHPPDAEGKVRHCTNSGTVILVCCYMDALGKCCYTTRVASTDRGSASTANGLMPSSQIACPNCRQKASIFCRSLPRTFFGARGAAAIGADTIGSIRYRNGFVHQYYPGDHKWGRSKKDSYWKVEKTGKVVLNLDGLVRGFEAGIDRFRKIAVAEPDLRTHIVEYLTARDE